jgi:hypothetical protein
MHKKFIATTVCIVLVLAGFFFMNIAQSSAGSVIVSQPQLDTAACTAAAQKTPAANERVWDSAVKSSVQINTSSSENFKNGPMSVNGQRVERYSSKDEARRQSR